MSNDEIRSHANLIWSVADLLSPMTKLTRRLRIAGGRRSSNLVYTMRSSPNTRSGALTPSDARHELAIEPPERLALVHKVRKDDPAGIEAYWQLVVRWPPEERKVVSS